MIEWGKSGEFGVDACLWYHLQKYGLNSSNSQKVPWDRTVIFEFFIKQLLLRGVFKWAPWQKLSMAGWLRETYPSQAFEHAMLSQKSFVRPSPGKNSGLRKLQLCHTAILWTRGNLDVLHIISHIWAHPLPLSILFPVQPPTPHLEAISLPRVPACSSFP